MRKFFFLFALLLGAVTAPAFAEDFQNDYWFNLSTLNPSIFGEGSYNSETHTLHTGSMGFGGWYADDDNNNNKGDSIDLSGYDQLTIVLHEETNYDGAQFRLFDENSYWAECASYEFKTNTLTIDLQNMKKWDSITNDSVALDPSHIYYAGFWTYGDTIWTDSNKTTVDSVRTITIESIVLTKNEVESDTTGIFPLGKITNIEGTCTCTYDDTTESYILQTSQYGFAGWHYDSAIDLSGYSKIVIELDSLEDDGLQFRLYNGIEYLSGTYAEYDFDSSSLSLTIDLTTEIKNNNNEDFDLGNITFAGFWSYGGSNYIKSITLYDKDGTTTGINTLPAALTTQNRNGVYTLMGVKVSDDDSCLKSLSRGIYIVNGRKVAIR